MHHSVINESRNTKSAVEVTPVFAPQKKKQAVFDSSSSSEFCGAGKVRYQSEEDIESNSNRLNSSKGYDWGVHSRCVGIHYENSDTGEKGLDKWTRGYYFCAKDMPIAEPVGWDAEKKEEFLLEKTQESFETRVNKIKKLKSKNVKVKKKKKKKL